MFDSLGIEKRKKEKCENFIKDISTKSDEYLFNGLSCLDMDYINDTGDEYTQIKLNAIENELTKRGYVDDMNHIISPKQFY